MMKSGNLGAKPKSMAISTSNGLLRNNIITAANSDQLLELNREGEYFMVFPTTQGAYEYTLFVDYTLTTIDPTLPNGKVEYRTNAFSYLDANLQPGKAYNIIIHLGVNDAFDDSGTPIPVDPDPDPSNPNPPVPMGSTGEIHFSTTVADWELFTPVIGPR